MRKKAKPEPTEELPLDKVTDTPSDEAAEEPAGEDETTDDELTDALTAVLDAVEVETEAEAEVEAEAEIADVEMDALPLFVKRKKWWQTTLAIIGAALVALCVVAYVAVVYTDAANARYVPVGVYVQSADLSGMNAAQVHEELNDHLQRLAALPLELLVVNETERVTLGDVASFDAGLIADEALAVRAQTAFVKRFRHDWLKEKLPTEITLHHAIDKDTVTSYVEDLADRANRKPKNAKLVFVEAEYIMAIKPDKAGISIDTTTTIDLIVAQAGEAIKAGRAGSVTVPYLQPKAKITAKSLSKKTALIVSLTKRRIFLFKGDKLVKTYPCAIGTPAHPTPRGDFIIEAKRYMPTWSNPGSGWAKDMPATIAPGPSNPLGLRALNLNYPGIRIHGTTNIGSIGSAASHGCMRVPNSLIVDLYPRVEVNDPVYIRF